MGIALLPDGQDVALAFARAEEKKFHMRFGRQFGHHIFHAVERINLALVLGKGGYPYPIFARLFGRSQVGIEPLVALLGAKQRIEVGRELESQRREHLAVAVERGPQRMQRLALAAGGKPILLLAPLVDDGNPYAPQFEKNPQELRAQHIVQIGHGIDRQRPHLLGQLVEAAKAFVPALHIGDDYLQIARCLQKELRSHLLREHDKSRVGVGPAHRIDNGYGHGYIAQSRQSDN